MKSPLRAAALALLLGLAGCSLGGDDINERFHDLSPPATLPVLKRGLAGPVMVEKFDAEGTVAGRPILYSHAGQPGAQHEYSYELWTQPPGTLMRDRMVEVLLRSGAAKTVFTPDKKDTPDYTINGRIHEFRRILGDRPAVRVRLEVSLYDERRQRMAMSKIYTLALHHPKDTMDEAVRTFSLAVDRIFTQFLKDATGG